MNRDASSDNRRLVVAVLGLASLVRLGTAADPEAPPAVTRLAAGWQARPDLDGEVTWHDHPPPGLAARWLVHAMSRDGGRSVGIYAAPQRFLEFLPDGWRLPDAKPGTAPRKYLRIGRLADVDGAETWLILLQEDAKPVIVHIPPASEYFVARQFKKAGDDWAEDMRWIVTTEGRRADAATPAAPADAPGETRPPAPARVPDQAGGVLPIEYLSPWQSADARVMLDLFRQNQWPQSQSLTSGLMVSRTLDGAPGALRLYDVIYKVGEVWLKTEEDVKRAFGNLEVGTPVEVKVKRLQPNSKGVPTWMPQVVQVTPISPQQAKELAEAGRRARSQERARRYRERTGGQPLIADRDGVLDLIMKTNRYVLTQERRQPAVYREAIHKVQERIAAAIGNESNPELLEAMKSFTPAELACLDDLIMSTDWGRGLCRNGLSNAEALLRGYALLDGVPVEAIPQAARAPDVKSAPGPGTAFRDLTWGDRLDGEFERAGDPGDGSILYRRRGDKLQIGDAPLKSILYAFRADRLERVMVLCEPAHAGVVERALRVKYGDPVPAAGVLNWEADGTMISLDVAAGTCLFSRREAVDQTSRERADRDRRAAEDL